MRWRGFAMAGIGGAGLAVIMALAGCTSPPAVGPLLRSVGQVLAQEQKLLGDDAARDAEYLAQNQAALVEAFEADLREQQDPSPQWVLEATRVYVASREALLRHDAQLQRQREIRADNLRMATQAQQRALELIEKQDQLVTSAGVDVWRLTLPTTKPDTEKSP